MAQETSTAQPAPPLAGWVGFIAMCIGMFMAILDIQIVATSLPNIQEALAIRPDQMSWIQTSYLIAEVIAIPLTGWLTRVLSLRGLFVVATGVFVIASVACASSTGFAFYRERPHRSRVCRRRFDTHRLFRGLRALSGARSGARHHHCRRACRSGSDRRARRWRMDHLDLQLALALSDQCGAWHSGDCDWISGAAARRDAAR